MRGTEYLIRVVDPSAFTKVTGYIRVNTLRLILVTAARLAFNCRLCSAQGNVLKSDTNNYRKIHSVKFEPFTNDETIAFGWFEESGSFSRLGHIH